MGGARWVLWLSLAAAAEGAGDVKLWELGGEVERRPKTVFFLFVMVTLLTLGLEWLKHKAEHATEGTKRGAALSAIFSELMMIGVVSFLLILAAELGVTDIKISSSCGPGDWIADGSGSGSGGNETGDGVCFFGFDVLLFEDAHLVLFFMGITYGLCIQVVFGYRRRSATKIAHLQQTPLGTAAGARGVFVAPSVASIMGLWDEKGFKRALVVLRNAMVIHLEKELRSVCHPVEYRLEQAHAVVKGKPCPLPRAVPNDATSEFCLGRFTHKAMGDTLLDLLHVTPMVWLGIIGFSALNLIHTLGPGLAQVLFGLAFLPIVTSLFQLMRLARQLQAVVLAAVGHPEIDRYNYRDGLSVHPLEVSAELSMQGRGWACGGLHPWEVLTGCCAEGTALDSLDPNDPKALARQIQLAVFCSCFFLGEVAMLSLLIVEQLGVAMLLVLTVLALLPLVWFVPRMILLFTLTHATLKPRREWLIYALTLEDSGGIFSATRAAAAAAASMDADAADPLEELRCALNQRHRALVAAGGGSGKSSMTMGGPHLSSVLAQSFDHHDYHHEPPLKSPQSRASPPAASSRQHARRRSDVIHNIKHFAPSITLPIPGSGVESLSDAVSEIDMQHLNTTQTLAPPRSPIVGQSTPVGRRRHPLHRNRPGSQAVLDASITSYTASSPSPKRRPSPMRRPATPPHRASSAAVGDGASISMRSPRTPVTAKDFARL